MLTQIAAQPDMPVRIWVLGETRSVPNNWFHVDLNWKKLDWLNEGSNYVQLVTDAVNEAAGHGFVTEFAGSTELLKNGIHNTSGGDDPYNLANLKSQTNPVQFIDTLLFSFFGNMPETLNLLRKYFPVPEEFADQELVFYGQPWQHEEYLNSLEFDPEVFVAELEEIILKPMKEAQEMFDTHPYVTRLFSTVSPEEMNRDPIFGYNENLGDVSHIHEATGEVICNDENIKTILLTLPNGEVMTTGLPDWIGADQPEEVDDYSDEPAAAGITMVGEAGTPLPVNREYVDYFDNQLEFTPGDELITDEENQPGGANNPAIEPAQAGPQESPSSGGDGCAATHTAPLSVTLLALFFAATFVFIRRTRRQ